MPTELPIELPTELPEGYYLENFEYLLEFVCQQYPHLLSDAEQGFCDDFRCLPEAARKLYVRLANRKGPYFRRDKLSYQEIDCLETTLEMLVEENFAEGAIPAIEEAASLCSKPELSALPACCDAGSSARKPELIQILLAEDVNPVEVLGISVVELLRLEELQVLKLLFFGNFHQDMTEFVLHELVAPFERYPIEGEGCLFRDREVVDELVQLKNWSDASRDLIEIDSQGEQLVQLISQLPRRNEEPLLARRYDKIVNRVGRQLERLDCVREAVTAYRKSGAPPAREREARVLAQLDQPEDALGICVQIAEDPHNEEELEFACKFGNRVARKYKLECPAVLNLDESDIPQGAITVPKSGENVELCARQYYEDLGFTCWYVENSLMRSLFGLCFWDVVYAPVSGAFFHPFQRGPTDLYTPDFVDVRASLIEARLDEISSVGPQSIALPVFRSKYGIANAFVGWSWLDEESLEFALEKIPHDHLLRVFKRMLTDLKNNSSGFPDLIVFHDDGYRMIEIKGPGDKIQKNQARWFRYFVEQDIPAELINVEYET